MSCQTFVKNGATLTIEAGVTIVSPKIASDGKAPALVIEKGAKIMAIGTASAPITFTTSETTKASSSWGGLILLGNAPISQTGGSNSVEGLPAGEGTYGGTNPSDSSGVLKYVRVWYGGSVIGRDNEINGITFAGVGSGKVVENIEVAFNKDDGVEFFGGTVDVKRLSVIYARDDAIDTDEGYQGRIQYAFVMLDRKSHHGTEMDSKTNGDLNSQPRSFPQLYNALFVSTLQHSPDAQSSDDLIPAVMRLREGTGGMFGNIVITNVANVGVYQDQCGDEVRTSDVPAPSTGRPNFLWFSQNNVIYGPGKPYDLKTGCSGLSSALRVDPNLISVPDEISGDSGDKDFLDPRPILKGAAFDNVDAVPQDGWFEETAFKGAFGPKSSTDIWIDKYSWVAATDKLIKPETRIEVQEKTKKESDDELAAIIGGVVGGAALIGVIAASYMYYQRRLIKQMYDRLVGDFQRSQMEMTSAKEHDEGKTVLAGTV